MQAVLQARREMDNPTRLLRADVQVIEKADTRSSSRARTRTAALCIQKLGWVALAMSLAAAGRRQVRRGRKIQSVAEQVRKSRVVGNGSSALGSCARRAAGQALGSLACHGGRLARRFAKFRAEATC